MSFLSLIDCNNFFVSCERLFRPDLAGKPVVVLSSNDGCIISRSEEAKALGFKMGEPYFKVRERIAQHGVSVFSSNFDLYRDISRRTMETLRRFSDEVEVYSVDEAFLAISSPCATEKECEKRGLALYRESAKPLFSHSFCPTHSKTERHHIHGLRNRVFEWGCEVRNTVLREVGIPVSVGIAPTKTLAKVATHFAKHPVRGAHPYAGADSDVKPHTHTNSAYETGRRILHTSPVCESPIHIPHTGVPGVCVLTDEAARTQALDLLPVEEIWGVGFRLAPALKALGIDTAGKLVQMDDQWIRACMSIKGLATVHELRGMRCLDVGEDTTLRKSLLHSQSFGKPVSGLADIRAAVAYHARKVAETLRTEHAAARTVSVLIRTSRHRSDARYAAYDSDTLPVHTNNTLELVSQALGVLTRIYRPGLPYAKAGVQVSDIIPESAIQPATLFGETPRDSQPLMQALDELRARFGPDVVRTGAEGMQKKWAARHELLSPRHTTKWGEIPIAKIRNKKQEIKEIFG